MRKFIGVLCCILGVLCILSSIGLLLFNRHESETAKESAKSLLDAVQRVIEENKKSYQLTTQNDEISDEIADGVLPVMKTIEVDGYECIGFLSIPVLELELPVLTDWSYEKLNKAPCHYYGSYYEKDFVIAGHNYKPHFGRLSELCEGDAVFFTDVNGEAYCYEVVLLETLPQNATKEMIASGFDLSLYTCTLGGDNRITVRCNAVDIDNNIQN